MRSLCPGRARLPGDRGHTGLETHRGCQAYKVCEWMGVSRTLCLKRREKPELQNLPKKGVQRAWGNRVESGKRREGLRMEGVFSAHQHPRCQ